MRDSGFFVSLVPFSKIYRRKRFKTVRATKQSGFRNSRSCRLCCVSALLVLFTAAIAIKPPYVIGQPLRSEKIIQAKSFDSLFRKSRHIQLNTSSEIPILVISDATLTSEHILILDSANHSLFVFDLAGNLLRRIGSRGQGPEELQRPSGLAIDDDGYIHIADSGNMRISVWHSEGRLIKTMPLQARPHKIAIACGHIYMLSLTIHGDLIHLHRMDGTPVLRFGSWYDLGKQYIESHKIPLVGGSFSIYKADTIFFVYSGSPVVRSYSSAGEHLSDFAQTSSLYLPPPDPPLVAEQQALDKWRQSWTPLTNVVATLEGFIIVQMVMPSRNASQTNVLLLYDQMGNLLNDKIETELFLLRQSSTGDIVFHSGQVNEVEHSEPFITTYRFQLAVD